MATLKNLVDGTTNIKNELVACHTNLKNNLSAKGVECSDNDKMSSLIDKVANIETGKKWASGTLSSLSVNSSGATIPLNLNFTPSILIIYISIVSWTANGGLRNFYVTNLNPTTIISGASGGNQSVIEIRNVTSASCTIIPYKTQGTTSYQPNLTVNAWYAFE